jgi:hypothetical protein
MTDGKADVPRFNLVFTWGGILVTLLGLILLARGLFSSGLLFTAAGALFWLYAKRRRRKAGSGA